MEWLADYVASNPRADAACVLGAIALQLAEGVNGTAELVDGALGTSGPPIDLPTDADVSLLAAAHEWLSDDGERHDRGMHYTPPDVARGLVERAVLGKPPASSVCDPSVGAGTFLLAAAAVLARDGGDRGEIAEGLFGADIDPLAVAVARTSVALWAGRAAPAENFVCTDALLDDPWPDVRFDWVVGNPPFLNQLGAGTSRQPIDTDRLRRRFGDSVSAYTDAAALFLLAAITWAEPNGVVVMVQPLSVLSARDTAGVRATLLEQSSLCCLWVASDVFAAAVNVCGVALHVGAAPTTVRRYAGRSFQEFGPVAAPRSGGVWAPLAAALVGLPDVAELAVSGVVGDLATATAGFRDEYYAIVEALGESTGTAGELPVVSVGSIDPLVNLWGRRPGKMGGRSWQAPVVRLEAVEHASSRVGQWLKRLLVPKLLVATQSATLEVIVDEVGTLVPLTPVVAVIAPAEDLWRVAAVLLAPPVSALAAGQSVGAARSVRALKLAAREVLTLPTPADPLAWHQGARAARRAHAADDYEQWLAAMHELYAAMNTAYAMDDDDIATWHEQAQRGTLRRVRSLGFDQ